MQNITFLLIGIIFSFISAATAGQYDNFLSAAKDADCFAVVESSANGSTIFKYVLPQSLSAATVMEDIPQIRMQGQYLLPGKDGKILTHNPPWLKTDNPENIYSLLARFKVLQNRDEAGFLISSILAPKIASLRLIALKRLVENNFFGQPMDESTSDFFREFYFGSELSITEKAMLLEEFARCNFLVMEEVFVIALSDDKVYRKAGTLYAANKSSTFSALMMKYIDNDTLWKSAIRQSELMMGNEEFAKSALTKYDYKNPAKNPIGFIPILLTSKENTSNNQAAIQILLIESKNTKSYELYRSIGNWINQVDPAPYQSALKTFINNNRSNDYIKDGIIYPSMLAALRKTQDPAGLSLALDYLSELRKKNNPQLIEKVCILFKKANQPNPTIDEVITDLTEQQKSSTAQR